MEPRLLTGIVGTALGWLLKTGTDYFSQRRVTISALYQLEGELTMAISQVKAVFDTLLLASKVEETGAKGHENIKKAGQQLLRNLPTIDSFSKNYAQLHHALDEQERLVAFSVISYYHANLKAFEDPIIDKRGLESLVKIVRIERTILSSWRCAFRLSARRKLLVERGEVIEEMLRQNTFGRIRGSLGDTMSAFSEAVEAAVKRHQESQNP